MLIIGAYADPVGDKALADLSQQIKDLGHYEADITINAGGDKLSGHYRVSGSNYHIDMGSVEFWGDENRRYEVSHKIEEIVISDPSKDNNTLLGNPSEAFDFINKGFDVVSQGHEIVLTPTPETTGIDIDSIIIRVGENNLPAQIIYKADSDTIDITLSNIKSVKTQFQQIELSKYRKYDVVELSPSR